MRALRLLPLLAALAACAGCRSEATGPAPTREIETVEVTAAPDAALSTAGDAQERRPAAAALAGALPGGFPRDVRLPNPSSLVDYVSEPDGTASASFDTPASRPAAEGSLVSGLAANGWRNEGGGAWSKAGRRILIAWIDRPAGCRFTIRY
jgi:hypothetical protein